MNNIKMKMIQLKLTIWQGPKVGPTSSTIDFLATFRPQFLGNYGSYGESVVKI